MSDEPLDKDEAELLMVRRQLINRIAEIDKVLARYNPCDCGWPDRTLSYAHFRKHQSSTRRDR